MIDRGTGRVPTATAAAVSPGGNMSATGSVITQHGPTTALNSVRTSGLRKSFDETEVLLGLDFDV